MNTEILTELKALTGFTNEDAEVLARHVNRTRSWAEEIAKMFYDTIAANPETAAILLPGERTEREVTLRKWYLELSSGRYDPEFWQRQWLVGLVHLQRGVKNTMVLSMLSRLQQFFLVKCLTSLHAQEAGRLHVAFQRASDVAAGLIMESSRTTYNTTMEEVSGYSFDLMKYAFHMRVGNLIQAARRDLARTKEQDGVAAG